VEMENPSNGNGMTLHGMNLDRYPRHNDDANVGYRFLPRKLLCQRLKHFGILEYVLYTL
jgi:hypothetical protein